MKTNSQHKARTILISFLIGCAAGVTGTVYFLGPHGGLLERPAAAVQTDPKGSQTPPEWGHLPAAQPHMESLPADQESPPPSSTMADQVMELRQRHLLLPLVNLKKEDLRDSFAEPRDTHIHEAIDIPAPRNTEIVAVEDGSIARLWYSVPGGITVYEFDPEKKYEYYYAHLERYADGLKEGDPMKRGQVIGYVGTSGNAPKDTPHLHFTIFKLTDQKHWWEGTAINPYLVYQ